MREHLWWKKAKFYELYVDKFAGNFRGLAAHMDYFADLGVNTLHILPHYPSPMVDQGYDITDYRGVRPELGTLDDFRAAIAVAHARGIHVIVDFIANHVSAEHPWFIEARSSRDNPKRDYFLWSEKGDRLREAMNCFPDIKPSNWIANPATGDHYFATFYPEQPDLNWDNPEVEAAIFGEMDFLADLGIDGFRLDAAAHLVKRDGSTSRGLPETHALLKRMRAHLEKTHPGVILLAEASQDIDDIKVYFGDGDECHMAYNFPLMLAMWKTLATGESYYVDEAVARSAGIPDPCQWATFLRNHDEIETRLLPTEERKMIVETFDPKREYLFNEGLSTAVRIATAFGEDRAKIEGALRLLYGVPGAPVMYYGDEVGITNLPARPGVVDKRVFVRGAFDWERARKEVADPGSLFHAVARTVKGVSASPVMPVSVGDEVSAVS